MSQRKLDQKNHDNEMLQDNFKQLMQRKITHTQTHCIIVPLSLLSLVPLSLALPLLELEERSGQGEDYEERINSLEKELKFMEVKKNEAINKLAQVCTSHTSFIPVYLPCPHTHTHTQIMFSRTPARGGSSQPSSGSRRQEREIRKLRGELQHETQKFQNMVKKYQEQLEEVSNVSDVIMM